LKTLVYNRKLQDGPGASIYGLEVCKSLQLPEEFIERAYEIRNKYDQHQHNILDFKSSKYNKDKLRGLCEFCNEHISDEIHHLKYQKDFKDVQLHNKANLSGICQSCHDKIHSLNLIYERKKTLNGYKIILLKN
jgi:DNA mismatch repair protein MutS